MAVPIIKFPLNQYMSSDGKGGGIIDFIGDYSGGQDAFIQPDADQRFNIMEMRFVIGCDKEFSSDGYGGQGVAALTNGIVVELQSDQRETVRLLDTVKTIFDWVVISSRVGSAEELAATREIKAILVCNWTMFPDNSIFLNGASGDRLVIRFQDDMQARNIVHQKARARGYIANYAWK